MEPMDRVRNETVRERLRLESVLNKVERRRECWKEIEGGELQGVWCRMSTGEGVGRRQRGYPAQEKMERFLLT